MVREMGFLVVGVASVLFVVGLLRGHNKLTVGAAVVMGLLTALPFMQ
jgi:hypothetical protein